MMRMKLLMSVLGFGLLACAGAFAQGVSAPASPGVAKPLTLQEAIQIAMANQIDIKVGQNNVTIARGRLTQARSEYFPSVTVQNNTFRTGSGRGVLGTTNTGTALTVSQNFFDAGLREANVKGT